MYVMHEAGSKPEGGGGQLLYSKAATHGGCAGDLGDAVSIMGAYQEIAYPVLGVRGAFQNHLGG